MTAIPGPLDIKTDVDAMIVKIDTAIAAAQVEEADTSLDPVQIADATERIALYNSYRTYALGFYSVT